MNLILAIALLFANSLQTTYARLDPTSVAQHFAFYELYPDTPLGREALRHAWELLRSGTEADQPLPSLDIHPLIGLFHRSFSTQTVPTLGDAELQTIERLAYLLPNRSLKGFGIWDMEGLLALKSEEIDLTRGLFLAELEQDTPENRLMVRSYEAYLDLMALQILARFPESPTPRDKIRAINDYIFGEMRFRFPPHSLYAKDIDQYTLLPSVLDSRRGVCLGVSILYLCLAQRLDLSLEVVTPPGHIYVRHVDPATGDILNIETTARGIDIPSKHYLGIETKSLQTRTIREVIGLAFQNQAAVSWQKDRYEEAIQLYRRAAQFLKDDYLISLFLGLNYLFAGKIDEGKALLQKIRNSPPAHAISRDTLPEDLLDGKADPAAIRAIFSEVDERRSSILNKQKKLEEVVTRCPSFRQGILHLAITYLQLGREKEALPILERYVSLHPDDPTVNYYLSAIHLQRIHFNEAWRYLNKAEQLTSEKGHYPQALKELRDALQRACPEPA